MSTIQIPPVEPVSVSLLKVDGQNPNRMTKDQHERLATSIKKYGFIVPLITNRDLLIADGEQRFEVAKSLGMAQVPVIRLEVEDVDRRLLRQVLNKLRGEHELIADALEFEKIIGAGREDDLKHLLDLNDSGLERYLKEIHPSRDEDYEIPEIDKIKTTIKRGDVYLLGKHRLMCGDATDKQDVEALMNGQKVDMVFTDPPYNEGYDYRNSDFNDTNDNYWSDLATAFNLMNQHLSKYGSIYIKHSSRQIPHMLAFLQNYYQIQNIITWISNSQAHPKANYDSYYEPLYFCTRDNSYTFNKQAELRDKPPNYWSGEGKEFVGLLVNVWYDIKKDQAGCLTPEIPTVQHCKIHPCSMPVRLPERAIKVSSLEGQNVLDIFGGSGSTLITCEQTGRICYMMEIDPRYCQVITDRWEVYMGQKAVKTGENNVPANSNREDN